MPRIDDPALNGCETIGGASIWHPAVEGSSQAYGRHQCTQHSWTCRRRIERGLTIYLASAASCVRLWPLSPAASTWCCRRREPAQAGEDRSLHDYAADELAARSERCSSITSTLPCSRGDSSASSRAAMLPIGPCFPGRAHGRCMAVPASCHYTPRRPYRKLWLTRAPQLA